MPTSSQATDEDAVATEYAILAPLIVVIVAAVTQLGVRVTGTFASAAALI